MGDTRRLAGMDVVVTGCIIKGRHGHGRRRQATRRQAPQRARLRVDGRGGQSRLNRGSPMLNALRPKPHNKSLGWQEQRSRSSWVLQTPYRQAEQANDSASTVSPAPPTGRIWLCLPPAAEG
jgi:hypothetical protein